GYAPPQLAAVPPPAAVPQLTTPQRAPTPTPQPATRAPAPQVAARSAPSHAAAQSQVAAQAQTQRASTHDAASRPLYQPTEPASVRPRAAKPAESLFGADILSEKSLDE